MPRWPDAASGRRRADRTPRPRGHRGQRVPRRQPARSTRSGSSAARSPARRWWPRPARSSPTAACTRCTPTSCGPATRPSRSSTRSTGIRDGRSFTTRRVVAIQHGRPIFNLSASFHIHEEGFDHQVPMPADVPAPESLPDFTTRWAPWRRRARASWLRPAPADRQPLRRLDARRTGPSRSRRSQRIWIRADGRCPTTRSCTRASSPTRRT